MWIRTRSFCGLLIGVAMLTMVVLFAGRRGASGDEGKEAVIAVDKTMEAEIKKLTGSLEDLRTDLKKLADENAQHTEWISRLSLVDPPVGTVMAFAGAWPPKRMDGGSWTQDELGWIVCRGDLLPKAKYPELFAAIGTAWGAEGDSFRIPNLAGQFLRGADYGAGHDPDAKSRTALYPNGNAGDLVGTTQSWATHGPHVPFKVSSAGAFKLANANVVTVRAIADDGRLPRWPAFRHSVGTVPLADIKAEVLNCFTHSETVPAYS